MPSSSSFDLISPPPSWLRSLAIFFALYLAYLLWSSFIRSRRELNAASSILQQRRNAGIPDSDKRPFKIAKAAVEAISASADPNLYLQSVSSLNPSRTSSAALSPPSPRNNRSRSVHQSTSNLPHSKLASPTHPSINIPSSRPITPSNPLHLSKSSSTIKKSISKHSASPLKPSSQPMQAQRSNQKRVASSCIDAQDIDESGPENQKARNRKKVKTRSDDLSSKRSSQDQAGLALKKPKPSTSFADHPSAQERECQDNHHAAGASQADRVNTRKKRILSDCTSELDADHALRTKKGRSDQPSTTADDNQPDEGGAEDDLMQVDNEDEEMTDEHESSGDEDKSDEDVYMFASDGQRKKLVKIRPNSPELDELQDENTLEQRWVTRSEFRELRRRGLLHLVNTRWDNSSRASTDTANSTLNSPPSSARTPSKQTPTAEAEHGPIWNIESKPGSRSSLSASKPSSRQLHLATRPRNSLGRLRLSLPPEVTSPIPRSRSQFSLFGNHRRGDDGSGHDNEGHRDLLRAASAVDNSIRIGSSNSSGNKSSNLPN